MYVLIDGHGAKLRITKNHRLYWGESAIRIDGVMFRLSRLTDEAGNPVEDKVREFLQEAEASRKSRRISLGHYSVVSNRPTDYTYYILEDGVLYIPEKGIRMTADRDHVRVSDNNGYQYYTPKSLMSYQLPWSRHVFIQYTGKANTTYSVRANIGSWDLCYGERVVKRSHYTFVFYRDYIKSNGIRFYLDHAEYDGQRYEYSPGLIAAFKKIPPPTIDIPHVNSIDIEARSKNKKNIYTTKSVGVKVRLHSHHFVPFLCDFRDGHIVKNGKRVFLINYDDVVATVKKAMST